MPRSTSSSHTPRAGKRTARPCVAALALLSILGLLAVAPARAEALPAIRHVVVVMEENHAFDEIVGNTREAPYLNALASSGASFTDARAIEHPSQPNYLDLFSGGNRGVRSDGCLARQLVAPNLASELLGAGLTFVGYAEGLPAPGSLACFTLFGGYARKHAPWTDFAGLDQRVISQPFSRFPRGPADFDDLPTVAFVIPNQWDDMHSGSIATADRWIEEKLGSYVEWARAHASLLIIAWDEDDGRHGNRVPLIIAGAGVRPGDYGRLVTHFSVLRLVETLFGLPLLGASATAPPIGDIWQAGR